jgi:hypothetical protein
MFFETGRRALRWQRLAPFEKFAALTERHWDGIAAYCAPENKVALGFVEGLNNKVRVIQRRCYGIRDEQYLRLKVLTCTLPPLPRDENQQESPTRFPEEPLFICDTRQFPEDSRCLHNTTEWVHLYLSGGVLQLAPPPSEVCCSLVSSEARCAHIL